MTVAHRFYKYVCIDYILIILMCDVYSTIIQTYIVPNDISYDMHMYIMYWYKIEIGSKDRELQIKY